MFDKTNAPNQLHTGLVLLSDVQPLHNAVVGQVHFLPFSQLFSELFRLMSSDIYSWCSVCHLCMFRAFYSKIPQHLEGRRAGNKTGNLCFVGFIEIKKLKLLASGILDASYILIIIKLCYILTKRNPNLGKSPSLLSWKICLIITTVGIWLAFFSFPSPSFCQCCTSL